jgi:hypothetical protein
LQGKEGTTKVRLSLERMRRETCVRRWVTLTVVINGNQRKMTVAKFKIYSSFFNALML